MSGEPEGEEAAGARLRVHFSPQADLYFLLRHVAAVEPADAGEWSDLVGDAREVFGLVARVPSHFVDGYLAGWPPEAGSAAEVGIHDVPDELMGAPLREFIVRAARLLESVRERYEQTSRSRRQAAAEAAIDSITQMLPPPVEAACLRLVAETFGFRPPSRVEMPVAIVASGVPLGGLTSDDRDDQPLCVVNAQGLDGTLLAETVIHEAIHALGMHDRVRDDGGSPVARLRDVSFSAAGGRGKFGQLWHVPYFVTAAEAVRRFVDADHVPYGEARGYYGRAGRPAEIVLPIWTDLLAERCSPDEAVDRIIAAVDTETDS